MGHEDDGFGPLLQRELDSRDRPDDALVVCDFPIFVHRNVEVDPHHDTLSCHVDVFDALLVEVHLRHGKA